MTLFFIILFDLFWETNCIYIYIYMCFFFVLENTCDYHQNHAYNSSSTAEQTLIGTSIVRVLYDYLIKYLSCFLFNLGMVRTMLSFSAIHILLLIITFICGLYSIREYRYTYKRLTGMIYILTGTNWFRLRSTFW